MTLQQAAQALQQGATVNIRPRGNSMRPLIHSGQECVITPAVGQRIERGDVVLCKVRGRYLLHKVTGVSGRGSETVEYRISNNRGRVNGWAPEHHVYGILTEVRP